MLIPAALLLCVASLTLTEFDVYSQSLFQLFSGHNLSFALPFATESARVEIDDHRGWETQVIPIRPSLPAPSTDSVTCHGAVCVTYSSSLIRLFSHGSLEWSQTVAGVISAAEVFCESKQAIVFAAVDQYLYTWNAATGSASVYRGGELVSLQSISMKSGGLPYFQVLIAYGFDGERYQAFVYSVDPTTVELLPMNSYPLFSALIALEVKSYSLVVLDEIVGIVEIDIGDPYFVFQPKGRLAGNLLAMSNVDRGKAAIASDSAIMLVDTSPLRVESYLAIPLATQRSSLRLTGEFLVLQSFPEVYVIEMSLSAPRVLYAFRLNTTVPGAGCWSANTTVSCLQENGVYALVTEAEVSTPVLRVENTVSSFSLLVQADDPILHAVHTVSLNFTHIDVSDSTVFFGRGMAVSTEPGTYRYESYFANNFSGLLVSFAEIFSGPALNYSIEEIEISPNVGMPEIYLYQSFSVLSAALNFEEVHSEVHLGCILSYTSVVFIALASNYVIMLELYPTYPMPSIDLPEEAKMCTAIDNTVWVYSDSQVGAVLYTLQANVSAQALTLVGTETLPLFCQKMKSNLVYMACEGSAAVFVRRAFDNATVVISTDFISSPHKPLEVISSCFLGQVSDYLALADLNNGLVVLDLSAAFQHSSVPFLARWDSHCAAGTSLHFSNGRLVVINATMTVYEVTDKLTLSRKLTIPQAPGGEPHGSILINDLLYVFQSTSLNIFDIGGTVHSALYQSVSLAGESQLMIFPISDVQYVLQLWSSAPMSYNLTLYEVQEPRLGPYLEVYFVCFMCLNHTDLEVNMTVVASNSQHSLSAPLRLKYLNKGTFPSAISTLPAYNTLISDQEASLPLLGLFAGNALTFSLAINGLTDFSGRLPPVIMHNLVAETYAIKQFCKDLQSAFGRVMCLSSNVVTVFAVEAGAITLETQLNMGNATDQLWMCESLASSVLTNSSVLIVTTCSTEANYTVESHATWSTLIAIEYDVLEGKEVARGVHQILDNDCETLKVGMSGLQQASIFCVEAAEFGIEEYTEVLAVQEYVLSWQQSLADSVLAPGVLLAPYNTNLSTFLPTSFDLIPSPAAFSLLSFDPDQGVTVLAAVSAGEYELAARVSVGELDALARGRDTRVGFCGGRVLLTRGGYMLVYRWDGAALTYERTIYPFSSVDGAQFLGELFCNVSARFVLAPVLDTTVWYFRLIEPGRSNDSSILLDVEGLGLAAVLDNSTVVLSNWAHGELRVYHLRDPLVTAPAHNATEFKNMTAQWGTNVFNLSVVATNAQGSVSSANVTLRRMLHHVLSAPYTQAVSLSPAVPALYSLFLLTLATLAVVCGRCCHIDKFK